MPTDKAGAAGERVVIIGAGVSGLAAAHELAGTHRVTLIEAAPRAGGHARTVMAGRDGTQPVDTGFIVFNKVNYPRLTALFEHLGVPLAQSDMSFGASFDGGRFEYALTSLDAIFAQRRNCADPRFLRMLRDVLRFNARGRAAAGADDMTIGELIGVLGLGPWFRDRYLLPLTGAIWSTPTRDILDFPARAMLRFMENHSLLGYSGQHQWYTVRGGSVAYVSRLAADLARRGVDIRLSAPVAGVRRDGAGAALRCRGGDWERFDEVVFATHADDTLAMLTDADPAERAALSAIRFQPNEAVLHSDPAIMPRRRKVWSSWVYTEDGVQPAPRIGLTYWMNSLQPIPQDDPLFVTLNGARPIRDELIHDVTTFRHPVYDKAAVAAQARLAAMNGERNTWFCGAWMGDGFHEDGFASAVAVTDALRRDAIRMLAA
ncbi:cyclopropane-fatty-acyl-phospholipid synthase [Rhodobacteraceae bacterium WD3A24]|nr:cyclopropane-fatty-acyl-phospholipid synthase [Rhodobacteraceae bacterium WD3A24]